MFKPGDYSANRSAGVAGLGELLYDTQRGIFGEEVAGGGIFSNAIDGLGASEPAAGYPWKEFSYATQGLQSAINLALAAKGFCQIAIDGKLGPGTCAAAKTAGVSPPAECQSFGSAPRKGPNCAGGSSGGGGVVGPVGPPSTTVPIMPAQAGMSSQTKALLAGGVAAVALIYYLKKRKKG